MLQRQVTPTEFTQLLGVELGAINGIRKGLRTVLDDGDTLRFRYQSFVDFLTSAPVQANDSLRNDPTAYPERFHINITAAHGRVCVSLFRVMNEGLRFNIWQIPSSFMHNGTLRQNEDEYEVKGECEYESEVEEEVEVKYNNGSKNNLTNAYIVTGEYTSPKGIPQN